MKRIIRVVSLVAITILLTGCKLTSTHVNNEQKLRVVRNDELSDNTSGAKKLNLSNSVGDITLTATDKEQITIGIKSEVRGLEKSKIEEIHDNIMVLLEQEGNEISIRVISKSKPKMNFSTWINTYYKGYDANVNLDIILPDTVTEHKVINDIGSVKLDGFEGEFDISVDIGDITAHNLSGKINLEADIGSIKGDDLEGILDVKVDIGDIKLSPLNLMGDSEFHVDTGSISANIIGLDLTQKIDFSADIGDIELQFAKDLSYEIEIDGYMEKTKRETINGGDTKIKATVDIGDIKIKN